MVRTFVEERELLFGQSCPLPDCELDEPIASAGQGQVEKARQTYFQPAKDCDLFAGEYARLREERDAKRASVATVKAFEDNDKRFSTSSVLTVQGVSEVRPFAPNPETDGGSRSRSSSASRRCSDIFAYGMNNARKQSTEDEDEDSRSAPPIAAHYIHIRKRSSSLANSINSTQSLDYSPDRRMQLNKMPSSNSLSSSGALGGSTLDSSLLSSTDQDSPKTTDDEWPISSKSMLGTSSSNGSMTSLSKRGTGGALDRPRPTTPNAARFFSR